MSAVGTFVEDSEGPSRTHRAWSKEQRTGIDTNIPVVEFLDINLVGLSFESDSRRAELEGPIAGGFLKENC